MSPSSSYLQGQKRPRGIEHSDSAGPQKKQRASADVQPQDEAEVVDYVAAVVGVELSPRTPTVEWRTANVTALPYIESKKGASKDGTLANVLAKVWCPPSLPIAPF